MLAIGAVQPGGHTDADREERHRVLRGREGCSDVCHKDM